MLREKGIKSVQGPSIISEQLSSYIYSIGKRISIPEDETINLINKIEDKTKIDYVEFDIEDINLNIELSEGESITRLV